MNKEDLLNDKDFLKSFKNGEDLTNFFKQMHKRAVEHMLEAELDAHLDNDKHQKTDTVPKSVSKIKSIFLKFIALDCKTLTIKKEICS